MNLWWAYALFDEDSLCANMKLSMAIIYVAGKLRGYLPQQIFPLSPLSMLLWHQNSPN